MKRFCPLTMASDTIASCDDRCILYNQSKGGCLIAKTLELYIQNHTPLIMKQPTEEELNKLTEILKETLAKHPVEPALFKHPDLNVKHDYDEHGIDWYPHGFDDIAP